MNCLGRLKEGLVLGRNDPLFMFSMKIIFFKNNAPELLNSQGQFLITDLANFKISSRKLYPGWGYRISMAVLDRWKDVIIENYVLI